MYDRELAEKTLADPAASYWLREAIRSLIKRDAWEVKNDLNILRQIFDDDYIDWGKALESVFKDR
jgi:hypothetical protein